MIDETPDKTVRVRVRYADTDQMGVAYNGIYFTWFEIGRTELLRHTNLTYRDIEKNGIYLPVIEAGVKFLKPARYDDVLSIRTYIERQKGVRIRFSYEITRDDELLATGFTEHVFTDKNLKPARPPKNLKDISGLIAGFSHNADDTRVNR